MSVPLPKSITTSSHPVICQFGLDVKDDDGFHQGHILGIEINVLMNKLVLLASIHEKQLIMKPTDKEGVTVIIDHAFDL